MMRVIILNVIMLTVVMLSVVALVYLDDRKEKPTKPQEKEKKCFVRRVNTTTAKGFYYKTLQIFNLHIP